MASSISDLPQLRAVFIVIRSEYWTPDVSRYRIGIARETVIPSLEAQAGQYQCFLQSCPADPFWAERFEAFKKLRVKPWWELKDYIWRAGWPYLLIEIPDDLIMSSQLVEKVRHRATEILQAAPGSNPCYLNLLSGGSWESGKCRRLNIDIGSLPIRARLIRSKLDRAAFKDDMTDGPLWYQPVHQQMDCDLPAGWSDQPESDAVCIQHVSARILSMYANMRIVTGTAEHATAALPRRTKSMYFLHERRGRRR